MRPTQLGVIGSLFHEGVLFTGALFVVRAKTVVVAFAVAFFIAFLLALLDLSTSLTAEVSSHSLMNDQHHKKATVGTVAIRPLLWAGLLHLPYCTCLTAG